MRNTGSEGTSEMVEPPGSTSDGAFSCTRLFAEEDEEFFWESLDEDCAVADWNPKARTAMVKTAANRRERNDMW